MNRFFKEGFKDGLAIGLGYLSVSFAFGIFTVGQGLNVWQAVVISITNLTSAGQLAAVPIIAASGSFAELALTQLVINLRYALMSISLSQKLDADVRMRDRFLMGYAMTDEIFATASTRSGNVKRRYFFGLMVLPIIGWTLGTLLGALAGDILPAGITSALGITIYGMFIAIVVPVARTDKATAVCVLISVALSCAFRYLPLLSKVSGGFAIIICAVVASAVAALLFPRKNEEGGTADA